jgi:hypothetical protein
MMVRFIGEPEYETKLLIDGNRLLFLASKVPRCFPRNFIPEI